MIEGNPTIDPESVVLPGEAAATAPVATRSWRLRGTSRAAVHTLKEAVWSIALLILLIGLWELIVKARHEPSYILPPPSSIVSQAIHQASGSLLPATWVTLQEILAGFGLGTGVGVFLAILITHSRMLARALHPLVVASQTIPIIAIAPIFIIWFGFGMKPKILMAALISFFPVVINTIAGLNSVERETLNLMRSLSANKLQIFLKIRFPASLPYFFIGLKQAAVISVIGAIVGEWVGATEGLGPLMVAAHAAFQTALVFAAIFYLATIGILMFVGATLLERLVIPWHFLTREDSSPS
jgi:ABC-type nitrate/sulfonate/bicarbonate transport system permease component